MISTKNIVRAFRHLDLKDKNLALNHAGSFVTIPDPKISGKISALAGPEIKQSDWLMFVIGPGTALLV